MANSNPFLRGCLQRRVVIPVTLVMGVLIALAVLWFAPVPEFVISVIDSELLATRDGEVVTVVFVQAKNDYSGTVVLDVIDIPEGLDVDFLPRRAKLGVEFKSRMRVTVGLEAPIGTWKMQVRATGAGGKTQTLLVPVSVIADQRNHSMSNSNNLSEYREVWGENINVIPFDDLKYASIFGGLENTTIYAYNAPWRVEGHPGEAVWDDAIAIHRTRYESNVKARYLFFDQMALDRALIFWRDLQLNTSIPLETVIDVRLGQESPQPIFFFWEGPEAVSILYPEPFLDDGRPQLVFQAIDSDRIQTFLGVRFRKQWEDATPIDLASALSGTP